jgi:type IV pilus assembly protein PilN
MIRINLLPFRAARKKENVRRQVSIFTLTVVLVLAGLGWYHLSLSSQVTAMERRVDDTKTELQRLEKQLKEINRISKVLATIERKTSVIEDLDLNREAGVRLLDAMTQLVIKDQMYLTRLRVTGGQVELGGIAADNQTIADFMVRLEGSGFFSRVILKATSADKARSGKTLQNFNISCEKKPLQRPETKKTKPTPKKGVKK